MAFLSSYDDEANLAINSGALESVTYEYTMSHEMKYLQIIGVVNFLVRVDNKSIQDLAVLTEPLKNVMKMKEIFQFLRMRIISWCFSGNTIFADGS